jgi:hypothetical protein
MAWVYSAQFGWGVVIGAFVVLFVFCRMVRASLLSFSVCNRGFHDLLRISPSSLFKFSGCISSSMASLISLSMFGGE